MTSIKKIASLTFVSCLLVANVYAHGGAGSSAGVGSGGGGSMESLRERFPGASDCAIIILLKEHGVDFSNYNEDVIKVANDCVSDY